MCALYSVSESHMLTQGLVWGDTLLFHITSWSEDRKGQTSEGPGRANLDELLLHRHGVSRLPCDPAAHLLGVCLGVQMTDRQGARGIEASTCSGPEVG